MFYYAILNENMFVVDLVTSETEITDSNYISITEDQYTNGDLLWLYYKPDLNQFIVCDNFIGSSDWIIYKNTDRPITPKFDYWNAKADGDHNHDEDYAPITHTHSEYAAGAHNHDELYASKTHETNSTVHVTATEKTAWNNKATADHNHDSTYANVDHVHTEFATAGHAHNTATTTTAGFISATDKAKLDGIATGATAYTHPETHPASMITGLPTSLPANGGNADTVDNCHASDFATATHDHDSDYASISHNHSGTYANASHTHSEYSPTSHSHSTATTGAAGFMSATDKAKLNSVAENANNYSHPASHPASMITETDGLKIMTAAERTKLSGIAENANNYVHPSSHSIDMITESTTKKVMTADERTKLSGIAANANNYSHPSTHPASMITGLADVATSGSYADLTNKPSTFTPSSHTHAQSEISGLTSALSGKASTSHTHSNASTSTAGFMSTSDKSKLDGIATGANKTTVDSALSSSSTNPVQNKVINTALAGKAAASHTHTQSQITGLESALSGKASASHTHTAAEVGAISTDLLITSTTGAFKYSYSTTDNKNVLNEIKNLPAGVFTVYSQAGVAGNPKTTEAWRMIAHKTGNTVLWVKAFGSSGSEYSNYCADGVWQGWRCIYDAAPAPLWTGDMYMAASHTIIPSKALSQCANGWVLLWSDYNPGESVQNVDFASTMIPKRSYNGGLWNNHQWLCAVPRYSNTEGEGIIIKTLHISDTQITGNSLNNASPRNDVVLRAVYEY